MFEHPLFFPSAHPTAANFYSFHTQAVDNAISTGEKTEKKEHKTAQKLNAADHAHNVAVQNAQKAEKEIKVCSLSHLTNIGTVNDIYPAHLVI